MRSTCMHPRTPLGDARHGAFGYFLHSGADGRHEPRHRGRVRAYRRWVPVAEGAVPSPRSLDVPSGITAMLAANTDELTELMIDELVRTVPEYANASPRLLECFRRAARFG